MRTLTDLVLEAGAEDLRGQQLKSPARRRA
jgi:hypothetical protein